MTSVEIYTFHILNVIDNNGKFVSTTVKLKCIHYVYLGEDYPD